MPALLQVWIAADFLKVRNLSYLPTSGIKALKRSIVDVTSTKYVVCTKMLLKYGIKDWVEILETVYIYICEMHVTGIEGRAGMAAIVDAAHTVDLKKFNHDLQQRLPVYARPVFVRLLDKLDLTG